jgi:hypothetical protein
VQILCPGPIGSLSEISLERVEPRRVGFMTRFWTGLMDGETWPGTIHDFVKLH